MQNFRLIYNPPSMDRASFDYELPRELIAQAPLTERSASRLLVVDAVQGVFSDRRFVDLVDWLQPSDLLVLNDTRVLPARLGGHKLSGGRVELLLERRLSERVGRFQVKASKSPKPGTAIRLDGGAAAEVTGRAGDLFDLTLDRPLMPYLEAHGAVPLPPYIDRAPEPADADRYQTVFAAAPGAVAAPTAGLHFDDATLDALDARGVARAALTLHVGAGTFSPVRTERIEDHRLHAERVEVSAALCEQVARTQSRGGRVVAVGTTTVRALETAAAARSAREPAAAENAREPSAGRTALVPFSGETDLFIYPGHPFRVVDAIVTNFHLPQSSLLMLVAAFAGHELVMRAYRHAVAERYRFFSYGDAMLLTEPAAAARAAVVGQRP